MNTKINGFYVYDRPASLLELRKAGFAPHSHPMPSAAQVDQDAIATEALALFHSQTPYATPLVEHAKHLRQVVQILLLNLYV